MRRALLIWATLAALALAASAVGLSVGGASLGWRDSWSALVDPAHPAHQVLMRLRLPRVADAFVVGALLAMAGGMLQVLLRNPLAEPYVLGLSGGAALGALAALALSASAVVVAGSAALGAGVSLVAVLALAYREFSGTAPGEAGERLLLSGVMLAALWGALIALVLSLSPESRVQGMIFWLMGDLGGAPPGPWAALVLAVVAIAALIDAPRLNLLARGDDAAAALGVSVGSLKRRIVLLAAIAAGAAVALAGTVGFVGLVAPHTIRVLYGNDQRVLLPAAALLGGTLVVLADAAARTLIAPQQLPVGAITAVVGAPAFLLLLWRSAR